MSKYLLNVTFHTDSDAPEDTDRGLYILLVSCKISDSKMRELFKKVNKLLNNSDSITNNFPLSYEQGINIGTLMKGVEIYTKGRVKLLKNNMGSVPIVDNYYEIEQWQFEDYFC